MKYDSIGIGYDATRRADPRIAAVLARLLEASPGQRLLDVACGTGNYTRALHDQGLDITGVDQSATMLDAARAKAPETAWHQADVAALPFADASFAGAICTLAIHHFTDLEVAFREVARVMDAGRLVILTSTPEQMRAYWLNHYFPDLMQRSIAQMPDMGAVRASLEQAGFGIEAVESWFIPPDPIDLFLYCGKHTPSLYLDPRVRAGISTFSALAARKEVDAGLGLLASDIETGEISRVMQGYASNLGDYTFIAARKLR